MGIDRKLWKAFGVLLLASLVFEAVVCAVIVGVFLWIS
jgi:hypothetical protein